MLGITNLLLASLCLISGSSPILSEVSNADKPANNRLMEININSWSTTPGYNAETWNGMNSIEPGSIPGWFDFKTYKSENVPPGQLTLTLYQTISNDISLAFIPVGSEYIPGRLNNFLRRAQGDLGSLRFVTFNTPINYSEKMSYKIANIDTYYWNFLAGFKAGLQAILYLLLHKDEYKNTYYWNSDTNSMHATGIVDRDFPSSTSGLWGFKESTIFFNHYKRFIIKTFFNSDDIDLYPNIEYSKYDIDPIVGSQLPRDADPAINAALDRRVALFFTGGINLDKEAIKLIKERSAKTKTVGFIHDATKIYNSDIVLTSAISDIKALTADIIRDNYLYRKSFCTGYACSYWQNRTITEDEKFVMSTQGAFKSSTEINLYKKYQNWVNSPDIRINFLKKLKTTWDAILKETYYRPKWARDIQNKNVWDDSLALDWGPLIPAKVWHNKWIPLTPAHVYKPIPLTPAKKITYKGYTKTTKVFLWTNVYLGISGYTRLHLYDYIKLQKANRTDDATIENNILNSNWIDDGSHMANSQDIWRAGIDELVHRDWGNWAPGNGTKPLEVHFTTDDLTPLISGYPRWSLTFKGYNYAYNPR